MTVIDMGPYLRLPCRFCLCDIPRREYDAHLRECRSKHIHPSNGRPGA